MFSKAFWKDAGERVISTLAQALLAVLTVGGSGLFDTDWASALSIAGMAALLSFLKAIVAARSGNPHSASFVDTTDDHPPGKHAVADDKDK